MPTAHRARWAGVLLALWAPAALAAEPIPHKPWGAPDLEGQWNTASLTMVERTPEFRGPTVPDDQAKAYERRQNDVEGLAAEARKAMPNAPDVGGLETEWDPSITWRLARIAGQARSAVIIDPASGRLPLRPEVRTRLRARRRTELRQFDHVEQRPQAERCLLVSGPPMLSFDRFQIVQTPDAVVFVAETDHEARIVPLGPRRAPAPKVLSWPGEAVGWWEGEVLVVETTGFHPGRADWLTSSRMPLSPTARVTERFSRTGPREILYRFTVDDPANYSAPWSGVLPFVDDGQAQFEYACHEGNYSLRGILAGARRAERDGGAPEPLDGGDPPPAR